MTPDFYGYIPDGPSRTLIFGCMIMNSALLLLSRSFCAALMMVMGGRYFVWCSAVDMGLYLLLKVMRKDFAHWFPVDGFLGILVSATMRFVIKAVSDYTGIIQFRGPAEMGGAYWSVNMIIAIASPFAAVAFYFANPAPDDVKLTVEAALRIVCSLSGAWLFSLVLFFALIKKEYRRTFWSLETGNEWAMSRFREDNTEGIKAGLLNINMKKWKPVEGEVKEWIQDNWERWEEEQPEFFTEVWKSRVPDDMLPPAELRRQKVAGGGQRRRSSLGVLVGGGAPSRRGSATVAPFNEGVVTLGDDDEG
jgi:hypothetical protein